VYVQVVVIAVYTFFLTSLLSNQYINTHAEESQKSTNSLKLDYIPILITLQFIFYMGWLKVAETMINPFGSDDDDFEVNYLIDRNLQTSYIIVDDMHHDHPALLKDQYWDQIPTELPDCGREERRSTQILQSDIFDVDDNNRKSMPRISKRPTNIFVNVNEDELPKMASPSKDSLTPRADVIDKTYHRLSNVHDSQSTLEREMQKARSQVTLPSESSRISKKSSLSLSKK
jgi:Bestrophin, RFP-TM, chloride channel